MSETTYTGSTLEEAIDKAAGELDVAVSDLQHEVVESKQDFWGGGDTVVIKAWVPSAEPAAAEEAPEPVAVTQEPVEDSAKASKAAPEAPAAVPEAPPEAEPEAAEDTAAEPQPAAVAAEASTADVASEAPSAAAGESEAGAEGVDPEAIKALLVQIFHDMEFDCTVEIKAQDDGFLASVEGADKEALLEGNGRCLSALELILNNAFRHKLPRGSKVHVDAGDFRSRRDQELADLAQEVARSAKDSHRTQETQPLNPYERRLVHLALAEDDSVTTRSRGTGFLKNVQVIPEDIGNRSEER